MQMRANVLKMQIFQITRGDSKEEPVLGKEPTNPLYWGSVYKFDASS